ncbi:MAG: hypothetical protein ACKO4U_10955, partial [Caldilinea sp.]
DGSPVVASGSGVSATLAYTYAAAGNYTATVTATNGVGPVVASTRVTVVITVSGADDFDNAPAMPLPFSDIRDTRSATQAADDPGTCVGRIGTTVWYRFTPAVSGTITVNTFGSNYDTVLALYTGRRGALSQVACNDDFTGMGLQSQISATLSAGVTYSLLVGSYGGSAGGNLVLNAAFGSMRSSGLAPSEPVDANVPISGLLVGVLAEDDSADNLNLTAEGTVDWALWGIGADSSLAPVARKNGVLPRISDLLVLSNGSPLRGVGQFGAFAHTFQWEDGTPIPSASSVTAGLQHHRQGSSPPTAIGEGFAVTVPADPTKRRVQVYATYHQSGAQVTATLSDGSAPPFVATTNMVGDNVPATIDITYAAASIGQTLTITWVVNAEVSDSSVAIFAVTLADNAKGISADVGEANPAEPAPPPAESPEAPAAQLYLPLIVQPSTEQGAGSVVPVPPMTPDTPASLDAIPELDPVVPVTSTSTL